MPEGWAENIGPEFAFMDAPIDQAAVGEWECPCGGIKMGPVYGTSGVSMFTECPSCGTSGEIMPLPKPSSLS